MVQWALYLDESGDSNSNSIPLKEGQQPLFILGGVALPLESWRDYDRQYMHLKIKFFKNEIDGSRKDAANWELKGNRITAPRNRDSERLRTFGYQTLDLIGEYGGQLFAVTFLKDHKEPMASHAMYSLGLQLLAERFDIFLREEGSQGISIIDSRAAHVTPGRGLDYRVATSYLSYLFGNQSGQQLKRLVEAPLFADSGLTAGVQIADVVMAMVYANHYSHYLGTDDAKGFLDYSHARKFWPPMRELQFMSKHNYGGYQKFGFRTIDHR
jgi:hypothetical protein